MITITKTIERVFKKLGPDPVMVAKEAEIKRAIRELKSYNDRELRDIGIPRSKIEHAVRYGIPANDSDFDHYAA